MQKQQTSHSRLYAQNELTQAKIFRRNFIELFILFPCKSKHLYSGNSLDG